jgi:hypothetical protein
VRIPTVKREIRVDHDDDADFSSDQESSDESKENGDFPADDDLPSLAYYRGDKKLPIYSYTSPDLKRIFRICLKKDIVMPDHYHALLSNSGDAVPLVVSAHGNATREHARSFISREHSLKKEIKEAVRTDIRAPRIIQDEKSKDVDLRDPLYCRPPFGIQSSCTTIDICTEKRKQKLVQIKFKKSSFKCSSSYPLLMETTQTY